MYIYVFQSLSFSPCACAESEADMLYLSRIRAATHAGCHRQRHRQRQRRQWQWQRHRLGPAWPGLDSEPLGRRWLWCTCWPALASLEHENLSKLITHTSAATLWTRLADVTIAACHTPHIPVALYLPPSALSFVAGSTYPMTALTFRHCRYWSPLTSCSIPSTSMRSSTPWTGIPVIMFPSSTTSRCAPWTNHLR